MISKIDKNSVRQRRHARVRKTVTGTAEAPRMNVYRSLNHIYVQIIDDRAGNEKGGVNPPHRKSKVSWARFVPPGSVGS